MPTIAQAAISHVGEPGPPNTCLSNGVQKWAGEAGLPQLGNDTGWVSVYRNAAIAAGLYVHGLAGVQVGDVLDWALPLDHMTVCTAVNSKGWVSSVGSGGTSGLVGYQPPSGYNPPIVYRGYTRLPGSGAGGTLNVQTAANTPFNFSPWQIGNPFAPFATGVTVLQDRNTWIRLGLGILGATLLIIALAKTFSGTAIGQQVSTTTKAAAKTAVEAVAVAPK